MPTDWKTAARSLLTQHFLFGQLDPNVIDALMSHAKPLNYRSGDTLFYKGDPGDRLLGVIEGKVRISTLSAEGKEVVLNVLGPGDVFGEIALLDGGERTADAAAMEATKVVSLDRRDLMPYLERHPKVCMQLLEIVCARLRWVSDLYEDAMFLHLPARLAKRLLKLADDFGDESDGGVRVNLKLSQQELGNMTGTTREAVNKVLRGWESKGLIDIRRSGLTIVDRTALEELVEFV